MEKRDRPKKGNLSARPDEIPESASDPKVNRHWVKRDVFPLLCCHRRNKQGLRAHLCTYTIRIQIKSDQISGEKKVVKGKMSLSDPVQPVHLLVHHLDSKVYLPVLPVTTHV